jgi:hypothetical protein
LLAPAAQATTLPAQVLMLVQAGAGLSSGHKLLAAVAMLLTIGFSSLGVAHWSSSRSVDPGSLPVVFEAEREPGPAFRNITQECGLAAIVNDKYAATPKWWLAGLHLVDLDGDGHLDFFMSAHGGGAVAALNDGKGNFKLAPGDYPPTEIHLAHDIDEDGTLDLAMTFQDGGGQWWLNRSKPGMLRFEPTKMERGTNTARRQALIDLNRDGKVDWLRGTPQAIIAEYGDGQGRFTDKSFTLPTGNTGRGESLCLPIDFDGDGQIDLISEWGHYTDPKGSSRLFRNDGAMKFADVTRQAGLPEKDCSIKGVGDVNQDGYPDLICLVDKQQFEIYLNDGKGRFTRSEGALQGIKGGAAYASWGVAIVTDFDNDGVPDILINGKNFLKVLRGTGDGKFAYMNDAWGIKDYAFSSVDDGLCFGDLDGDGDLDIVGYVPGGGDRRTFIVYRNDLPKRNWLKVRPVGLPGNRGAAGAKIRLTEPGTGKLLWYEQVAIYDSQMAHSCYSFTQTERHFGLGQRETVDVSIEFYPSGKKVTRSGVKADTTLVVREE